MAKVIPSHQTLAAGLNIIKAMKNSFSVAIFFLMAIFLIITMARHGKGQGKLRCCKVCKSKFTEEELEEHRGKNGCTLTVNGQKRADHRIEKHREQRDYERVMYFGAIPLPESSRRKAQPPLRFEDEAMYRHHGNSANLGHYVEVALRNKDAQIESRREQSQKAQEDGSEPLEGLGNFARPVNVLSEPLRGIPPHDDGVAAVSEERVSAASDVELQQV